MEEFMELIFSIHIQNNANSDNSDFSDNCNSSYIPDNSDFSYNFDISDNSGLLE